MSQILPLLATVFDLLLVVVGFGLIIVIHELGHFVAARWAGIRVFAFAVGFGPAVASYRKGMGWRRGSSEADYRATLADRGLTVHDAAPGDISPTEYRLNWLPFGGYVKMLGQEDANPNATSHAADSYQNCHPAKRLVVISAGVVANVVLAAFIFMFVFMVGLQTEPPRLGLVATDGPAAAALPVDPTVIEAGLRPGDTVLEIGGREARSFNDIMLASAMAQPGRAIDVMVERRGYEQPLAFEVMPRTSPATGLQEIGIAPAQSNEVFDDAGDREGFDRVMTMLGLEGVPPAARLVSAQIGDAVPQDVEDAGLLTTVFAESQGKPVTESPQTHLLGCFPVLAVGPLDESARGFELGLREGDVFIRLGSLEYPSITDGSDEIRRHAGKDIPIAVIRGGETIEFSASVSRAGQVGFIPEQTLDQALLARPSSVEGLVQPAIDRAGLTVVSIAGVPVSTFAEIRSALLDATAEAASQDSAASVEFSVRLPGGEPGTTAVQQRTLELAPEQVATLHDLGFAPPIGLMSAFKPAEFTLRADGPIDSVRVGLAETHRVMLMTYVTFARLFQGSVKVEHLKGPVGIAHLGTRVADRGLIWLLFFMALISVNLAVVNFLPIPIVDGGQFLFILFEWVRGKPVPEAVQSVATIAGLLLIGAAFLIVSFIDIRNVVSGL